MAQAVVTNSESFTREQALNWLIGQSPRIETTMAELARQWRRDGDKGRIWAQRQIEFFEHEGLIVREKTGDRRSIIHVHGDVRPDSPFYDMGPNTIIEIVPARKNIQRTSWRTFANKYVIAVLFVAVLVGALAEHWRLLP